MNAPAHNVKIFGPTIETGKINLVVIKHHWWLGSGIKDKNGVEIFEGDIVSWLDGKQQSLVYFVNGGLLIHDWDGYHLLTNFPYELEIVGHIAEDKS